MDQDPLYELIGEAMAEKPEQSPEHRLGLAIHSAFQSLDEIMAMGAAPETRELVQRDLHMLAQIKSRLEWLGTFITVAQAAREVPKFKVVR